jgi:hypothetical protein
MRPALPAIRCSSSRKVFRSTADSGGAATVSSSARPALSRSGRIPRLAWSSEYGWREFSGQGQNYAMLGPLSRLSAEILLIPAAREPSR